MNNMIHDDRLPEIRDLLDMFIAKKLQRYTNIYAGPDNNLVLQVDESVLYVIPLTTIAYNTIAFNFGTLVKDSTDDTEDEDSDEESNTEDAVDDRSLYYGTDQKVLMRVQWLYNYCRYSASNFEIVAKDDDLRQNEQFEELLKIKTDQGLQYFKLNGEKPNEVFLIPMFAGFLSLSKPDKIGIKVYDTRDGFLIVEFNIFKKKINRSISLYCRIIKL